jgi:hypothetical protein
MPLGKSGPTRSHGIWGEKNQHELDMNKLHNLLFMGVLGSLEAAIGHRSTRESCLSRAVLVIGLQGF